MAWEVAQLVCGIVKLEVRARQKQSRTRRSSVLTSWWLLAPGTGVPALGVVRFAMSGMTVAAENTIDQTNRKTEFLKLDLGDVATHTAQTTCVQFFVRTMTCASQDFGICF